MSKRTVLRGIHHTTASKGTRRQPYGQLSNLPTILLLIFISVILTGCFSGGRSAPTRTPFPTWTPTPSDGAAAPPDNQVQAQVQTESSLAVAAAPADADSAPAENAPAAVEAAPAPAVEQPPAEAPAPATPIPVEEPTETPVPEPTEAPTEAPTNTPTPAGPQYEFELEEAEKFPTDSLAENVVRVFLYVYGGGQFALPGYSLVVAHNDASLPVDATSTGGLPDVTRDEPGKYTRFTNMNAIFIEPQGGTWAIQLVDDLGVAVGPPAFIELAPDDNARELYIRYRLK